MPNIAILGFGNIGSGVAEVLEKNRSRVEKAVGEEIKIKYILDLRDFSGTPYENIQTYDIEDIINDESVSIVVETMGGALPAFEYSLAALNSGKSVVTSNKEVVARFGHILTEKAKENGVSYLFEASVGGGIPLIKPICEAFSGNEINSITGILNGTTNYILTAMFRDGKSYDDALREAQEKGYAEKDPTADVDGIDTKRKISILADLMTGKRIDPENVYAEGIRFITAEDVKDAEKWGGSIKLLGQAKKQGGGVSVIVAPFFVKNNNILAGVEDVFNGVIVEGNAVGEVMFYGKGAGKLPTASAVMNDIVDAANGRSSTVWSDVGNEVLLPNDEVKRDFYIRAEISEENANSLFGEIEVISKDGELLSFITRAVAEKDIREKLNNVKIGSLIRVL